MMASRVMKHGKGRRKVEIKKIENVNKLQVTFSKRRAGLFKKAGELCVLCGAEIAILTFSPAEKPYAYGHPSADSVINRFLYGKSPTDTNSGEKHDLHQQYLGYIGQLEAEKERVKKEIEQLKAICSSESAFWWDASFEGLDLNELEEIKASIEELTKNVGARLDERVRESSTAVDPLPMEDLFDPQTTDCQESLAVYEFGFGHGGIF